MSTSSSAPTASISPENSISDNVRYGYKLGWSFTPLSGKKPALTSWQSRPRETLEEALAWAARQNVGLRTGRASGVVVIDADVGADISSLNLPATVAVNTGHNGLHLYYRCNQPIGNSAGKLGPHIDVKGDRGQVVYPGSIHPDTGRRYEWAEGFEPWTLELAELPQPIIKKLNGPRQKATSTERSEAQVSSYLATALDREIATVQNASKGTRNNALNSAAFNLGTLVGGGYLERSAVEEALEQAALSAGLSQNEIAATVKSGIESGIEQPRQIAARTVDSITPTPRSRKHYILVPGPHKDDKDKYTEQSNVEFANAVLGELPNDAIYRKEHIPGEIIGGPGRQRWLELSVDRMRLIADTHTWLGKWVTSRKKDTGQVMVYKPCDRNHAGIIIAQAMQTPGIRELTLMVNYPIYGPGFVRVPAGWHDGLFYDEPDELQVIKPEPDCEVIHNILHDLVIDFPFKSEADRQNFFGLLLTPIITPALDGNRPLHMLLSPLERTGKTKLAEEVFGGIILGRQTPAMQITEHDEERDKRVIGLLLQGETLMHLDNLPRFIDSGALSSLLTATTYGGRILGGNRMVNLPNNLTIVGSGNNVQASGEIVKRTVPILLQPTTAKPEDRRDFQHPNLRAYIRSRRRIVLSCLLGLIENWIAAKKPIHPDKMGGFENWSGVIGGILQVNGLKSWRTNEGDWREQADPRGAEMNAFVELWYSTYGDQELAAKSLLELASENDIFGGIRSRRTPQAASTAFGRYIRRYADTPVGQWFIRFRYSGGHSYYHLEEITS